MEKTDVYVVVDTPKKAKKLKKLLDMFGENIYSQPDHNNDDHNGKDAFWRYGCSCGKWQSFNTNFIGHNGEQFKEVSIKELTNILAKEHLKGGDVVVMRSKSFGKIILEVRCMNGEKIDIKNELFVETGSRYNDGHETIGGIDFIRYATEEEKALLEPEKELEVGKWYKSWNDYYNGYNLSYYTGTGTDYGFHAENNNWFEEQYWIKNSMTSEWQEATTQEVEKALIEEAKRRGFVNGGVGNNSNIHDKKLKDCELFFNNEYEFDKKYNLLRVVLDDYTTWIVFKDGKWATIIEQDKFAELKEAHRNGSMIQMLINVNWIDVNNPLWDDKYEYRIKPSDNFTNYEVAIVERLHDTLLDNHGYSLESKLLTDARLLANKIKSNIK